MTSKATGKTIFTFIKKYLTVHQVATVDLIDEKQLEELRDLSKLTAVLKELHFKEVDVDKSSIQARISCIEDLSRVPWIVFMNYSENGNNFKSNNSDKDLPVVKNEEDIDIAYLSIKQEKRDLVYVINRENNTDVINAKKFICKLRKVFVFDITSA